MEHCRDCKAFSMLQNARDILEDGGYLYAKDIDRFLQTIPSQAAPGTQIDKFQMRKDIKKAIDAA